MKKTFRTLSALALVLILVTALCVPAFAADGNVTYDGTAQSFVFAPGSDKSPTDLFPDFKNVMPGDTLTQDVVVSNSVKNGYTIRLYIRALGAQQGSEEFLSMLKLTVKQDGDKTLFEAPSDETAQLTDWVYLGTYKAGATVTLNCTLEVPIELGNDFQEAIGYLDWQFKVEEIPTETYRPIDNPKTGDESNVMTYIIVMIVSMAVVLTLVFIGGKRRKSSES